MADLSDVETTLENIIAGALYPNGTSAPSSVIVNGSPVICRVVTGWPLPSSLDPDLASGIVTVSVHAQAGLEKNTTRYPQDWVDQVNATPTLTASVSGLTVTIGGAVTVGHFVTVIVGSKAYSYAAVANDTLSTIATALAALINADVRASASGAVITVAGTPNGVLIARAGAPNVSFRELERTNQRFLVTIWAPSNAARVAAARIIRPALAALDFLTYPDTSCGRILYEMSNDVDRSGKASALCRDFYYWIEYPTTETMTSYPVTAPVVEIETDGWTQPDFTPLPWGGFTPTVSNTS